MFMPNDVYLWDEKRVRILWSNQQAVFWINIDNEQALPQVTEKSELEHLLTRADLTAITDPYLNISLTSPKKGSKAEAVQDKAWDALKDAVKAEPEIYQRKSRGPFFKQVLENSGATKQTVYRWFRRYWQFGMCKNALSGRYDLCGGLGKSKTFNDKRNGRIRTRTPGRGLPITEDIKSLFRGAIEKCILNKGKYEFDYAYNQLLISYGINLPASPEDLHNIPTERQFKYFYQKEYMVE